MPIALAVLPVLFGAAAPPGDRPDPDPFGLPDLRDFALPAAADRPGPAPPAVDPPDPGPAVEAAEPPEGDGGRLIAVETFDAVAPGEPVAGSDGGAGWAEPWGERPLPFSDDPVPARFPPRADLWRGMADSLPHGDARVRAAARGGSVSTVAAPSGVAAVSRPLRERLGRDGQTVFLGVLLKSEGRLHAGAFRGAFLVTLRLNLPDRPTIERVRPMLLTDDRQSDLVVSPIRNPVTGGPIWWNDRYTTDDGRLNDWNGSVSVGKTYFNPYESPQTEAWDRRSSEHRHYEWQLTGIGPLSVPYGPHGLEGLLRVGGRPAPRRSDAAQVIEWSRWIWIPGVPHGTLRAGRPVVPGRTTLLVCGLEFRVDRWGVLYARRALWVDPDPRKPGPPQVLTDFGYVPSPDEPPGSPYPWLPHTESSGALKFRRRPRGPVSWVTLKATGAATVDEIRVADSFPLACGLDPGDAD